MSDPEDVVTFALEHMTWDQMQEWMVSPNPYFHGGRPIDYIESEVGRQIIFDAIKDFADGISSP